MMTSADLADLIALADTNGAKVTIAGDTGQLQAVQNGGGMTLIADRLSYARLAEPIRFHAPREQAHQAIRWGWPVTLAMRSKSLSPCGTVSPASSAVAA